MPDELFEAYADWYQFRNSSTTVYLEFTMGQPDGEARRLAAIRMSPEFAKCLAILLKKHVHQFETDNGIEIALPAAQLLSLGINLAQDWAFPPEG